MSRLVVCRLGGASLLAALVIYDASARPDWLPPPNIQEHPCLLASETGFTVLWSDLRDNTLARLYWGRTPLPPDTAGVRATRGDAGEREPAAASGWGWELAAWESWTDSGAWIRAAELPAGGAPQPVADVPLTDLPVDARRPAVAVHDSVGLVAWEDRRSGESRVYTCRWRRGKGPLDQPGFRLGSASGAQHHPAVAAGNDGFGMAWAEPSGPAGMVFRTFDTAGLAAAPVVPLAPPGAALGAPSVAFAAGRYLVAWDEPTGGGHRVWGRFVDATGVPWGDPFVIAGGGGERYTPRVASDGEAFWVVWTEQDAAGRSLRRGRVDTSGVVHPAGGTALTPPADFAADAALAVRDGVVLAAWRVPGPEDDDDLRAAWWAWDDTVGTPPDTALVLVSGILAVPRRPGPTLRLAASANPFRDRVWISSGERVADLRVFDLRGRLQRRLSGAPRVLWDGRDESGAPVPAGVYWVRVPGSGAALRVVKLP